MKIFSKNLAVKVLGVSFMFVAFGVISPIAAYAATSPSLGAAASYSVLSGAGATNGGAGQTTISGDFGVYPAASYTDGPANTLFLTAGNPHLGDGPGFGTAQDAQAAQLAVFNGPGGIEAISQPCTNINLPTWDLTGLVLDPGVYCTDVDFLLSGTLTLRGTGSPATDVWIFRAGRDFVGTGTANVVFSGTGGVACNVWWRLARDATFTAGNAMVGNILAANSITLGQGATLNGRAFAYTAAVTLLGNTISGPTCVVPPPAPVSGSGGTIFALIPNINITKIPNPLSLPLGPGQITYTYTVTNIGQVAMSNVWVKDDKCSNVGYVLGDINNDSKLDTNETWLYSCAKTVSQTETNTATAHGSYSGWETYDNANATVVVAVSIVPPLIHLLKTPSVFTLPAGGGSVTYTYTVTNPGSAPLSGVKVTDDKCATVTDSVPGQFGDLNKNGLLESNETWTFVCSSNLTKTTTNIGTAEGRANGLTAIDFSPAVVVVPEVLGVSTSNIPGFPNTGFPPEDKNVNWGGVGILASLAFLISSSLIVFYRASKVSPVK
ncbi:MAG: ice-binding family protein [Candidatus Paceibacterota bacterium]|jgi:hypothetical protein